MRHTVFLASICLIAAAAAPATAAAAATAAVAAAVWLLAAAAVAGGWQNKPLTEAPGYLKLRPRSNRHFLLPATTYKSQVSLDSKLQETTSHFECNPCRQGFFPRVLGSCTCHCMERSCDNYFIRT